MTTSARLRVLVIAPTLAAGLLAGCTPAAPAPEQASSPASTTADAPRIEAVVNDGQVSARGAGWPAGAPVQVAPCLSGSAPGTADVLASCDLTTGEVAFAGAEGSFEVTLQATPAIGVGMRREELCLDGACVLGAIEQDGSEWGMLRATSAPLAWLPSDLPQPPLLEVSDLYWDTAANSGSATITGLGFAPDGVVKLSQCPTARDGGVDAGDCLYSEGVDATADDDGAFTVTMAVYPRFQRSSGAYLDCVAAPADCSIADPWPTGGNRFAMTVLADG